MLKVSGALLVFFAGWGMGNWRSRQYQQRIKDLQILQLIISCLIGEISYARNTLPEAFSRISEKVASPFREYLQSVAKRLKEQTGEAFVRILKEQEQTVREKLPEGFQRAEMLLEKGAVDMIVDRRELRPVIAELVALLGKKATPAA